MNIRLSDNDFYTKSDLLSLTGMNYNTQSEYADQAGVSPVLVEIHGHKREAFQREDVIKILQVAGYNVHEIDGEQVLAKIKRKIKL